MMIIAWFRRYARYAMIFLPSSGVYLGLYWINRTTPWIGGFPFFMASIVSNLFFTWLLLLIFYFFDPANKNPDDHTPSLLHDRVREDFVPAQDVL